MFNLFLLDSLLLFFIFDWALIAISSLTGASLIVQHTEFSPEVEIVILLGLAVLGFVFQLRIMKAEPK
jgi:hypothetical protein